MKELKKTKIRMFFRYIFSFLFHSQPVVIVANATLNRKHHRKNKKVESEE
ncbi:MAG: hypothetical protein ACTSWX_14750 [Promethearchaeota archaeon]